MDKQIWNRVNNFRSRAFVRYRPLFKAIDYSLRRVPIVRNLAFKIYALYFLKNPNTLNKSSKFEIPLSLQITSDFLEQTVIVFDCQPLQGPSYSRGIGRFSRSLIGSFARSNPNLAVILYFNNFIGMENLERTVHEFNNQYENVKIFVSQISNLDPGSDVCDIPSRMSQEVISLNPSLVIYTSMFEHPFNVVPLKTDFFSKTGAIFYDVIPLQYPEIFLKSSEEKKLYQMQLDRLLGTDMVFSISKTSLNSLSKFTSTLPKTQIIYGSGYIFKEGNIGLTLDVREGILCVASDSLHKNVRNLIHSYSLLSLELRELHQLIVVGISSPRERRALTEFAKKLNCAISLTESLNDEKLSRLYSKSRVVAAPSWQEGLSMPILEAWNEGTVVIGSRNTAISEILDNDRLLFDPHDVVEISEVLKLFLSDDQTWLNEQSRLLRIRQEYTWAKAAGRLSDGIHRLLDEKSIKRKENPSL